MNHPEGAPILLVLKQYHLVAYYPYLYLWLTELYYSYLNMWTHITPIEYVISAPMLEVYYNRLKR